VNWQVSASYAEETEHIATAVTSYWTVPIAT